MGCINYANLRIGDVFVSTDLSPFADITRIRTWGWPAVVDLTKGTHTGVIVDRGGGLFYACEMGMGGLQMGELHKYDHAAKSPRNHFTRVMRHKLFDDPQVRQQANQYMIQQHAFGIKYGFKELLEYLFPKVHDDYPYKLICSQWAAQVWKTAGVQLTFKEMVAPKDWQCYQSPDISDVAWQK